ncbi:MAG: electron transfer flavoprotein subunit alpha/FixB family protein [Actinomycetota bacterium]
MTTWVFAEESEGAPTSGSLELVSKAATMGPVTVFYVGAGSPESFATLGDHGASTVHHLDTGDALPASPAAAALAGLLTGSDAAIVLFGMGNTDRDVAGMLAVRLSAPLIANALDVTADGAVTVTSEINGGSLGVTTEVTASGPAIVISRPKAFAAESSGGGAPEVHTVTMPDTGHSGDATITERHVEASEGPDLEAAAVVVTGGRGLGAGDKFAMVDELAGLLGGAVGGTRAVVDAGWVPYSYQIGQTGKTVKPNVYVAVGVSGAMQHLVGMKGSSTIIAINKDPDAPIFGIADLGIVGDLHKVVPQLIEAIKAR